MQLVAPRFEEPLILRVARKFIGRARSGGRRLLRAERSAEAAAFWVLQEATPITPRCCGGWSMGKGHPAAMTSKAFQGGTARFLLIGHAALAIALALPVCCAHAESCRGSAAAGDADRVVWVDPVTLHRLGGVPVPRRRCRCAIMKSSCRSTTGHRRSPPRRSSTPGRGMREGKFLHCRRARQHAAGPRPACLPGRPYDRHPYPNASRPCKLPLAAAEREIDDGIQSVQAALGLQMSVAPFFRAPYLQLTPDLQEFLIKREVTLWSVDIDPEDWRPQSAEVFVAHTLALLKPDDPASSCCTMFSRIRQRRCRSASQLRARGYSFVHAVATDAETSRSQSAAMPHRSTRGLSEPEDARAAAKGTSRALIRYCIAVGSTLMTHIRHLSRKWRSNRINAFCQGKTLVLRWSAAAIADAAARHRRAMGGSLSLLRHGSVPSQPRHNSAQLYHQQGLSGRRHVFHPQRLRHGARLLSRLF